MVALLLLENVASLLHLFGLDVFGAEEIFLAFGEIAAVFFNVHCMTFLVVVFGNGVVFAF